MHRTVRSSTETSAVDFQSARERFDAARLCRREAEAALEGAQLALETIHLQDRATLADRVYAKVQPFLDMSRQDLAAAIPLLERELEQARREQAEAKADYEAARAIEVARRAEEIRPDHEKAVRRIAKLVDELSKAVEGERAVRARLDEVGAGSAMFDAARHIGTLRDPTSPLAMWNRAALLAGAL